MAHNGGRLQANIGGFLNSEFWALNAMHGSGAGNWNISPPNNGTAYTTAQDPTRLFNTFIGADGYPTQMPDVVGSAWLLQVYINGANGTEWTLKYPSQHTLTVFTRQKQISALTTIAPGHKTFTITGGSLPSEAASVINLQITAMSGSDWTGGIQLYKTANQALIDAGELFDPEFLARLEDDGMIRVMDLQKTNYPLSMKFADQHVEGDLSLYSDRIDKQSYCGLATKTLNDYVTALQYPGDPVSWTDGQQISFWSPARFSKITCAVTAIGATTTINSVAHGLSTGKKLIYNLDDQFVVTAEWRTPLMSRESSTGIRPEFSITRIDDDNFTIPVNSTGFGTMPTFTMLPSPTITDGTLPIKRLVNPTMYGHYYSAGAAFIDLPVVGIYNAEFDVVMCGGTGGQFSNRVGLPPFALARLANKLKAHLWVCCPMFYNETEQQLFAAALHAELDPELLIAGEVANEPWNNAFYCQQTLEAMSQKRGFGAFNWMFSLGDLTKKFSQSMQTVIGSAREFRIGMQQQSTTTVAAMANAYTGNLNYCDFMAIAPYSFVDFMSQATAATYPGWVDCVLEWRDGDPNIAFQWFADELETRSTNQYGINNLSEKYLSTYVPNNITALAAFTGRRGTGVEHWAYEAGHHLWADGLTGGFPSGGAEIADVRAFYPEFLASEQYAVFLVRYFSKLIKKGMKWPSIYCIANTWSNTGAFGAQNTSSNYTGGETPALRRLKRFSQGVETFKLTAS